MAIDTDKLQEFLGRFVTDLGATLAAGNVVTGSRVRHPARPAMPELLGHRLGLNALAQPGGYPLGAQARGATIRQIASGSWEAR